MPPKYWVAMIGILVPIFALASNRDLPIRIAIPTEYDASSGVGNNLAEFARLVAAKSNGRIELMPHYSGEHGFKNSVAMLEALKAGQLGGADLFGGALSDLAPVFANSAQPFKSPTLADAERHHTALRPAYEAAFKAMGLRLLYVTPWPPTGIWSRNEIRSVDDLRQLKLRVYDANSKRVFSALGANAEQLPYSELSARLNDGTIDGVLSSGDGGMGRMLWKQLHYYNRIAYALPVSFMVISEKQFQSLSPTDQTAVIQIAGEINDRQWKGLHDRLVANAARMRGHGVIISDVAAKSIADAANSLP